MFSLQKLFKLVALLLVLAPVVLASVVIIYKEREKITEKLYKTSGSSREPGFIVSENDEYWANKILDGGYILHFRHAERDKWIDVPMYDALESDLHKNGYNDSRYAENDYFAQAVCLNKRGKVQAKAMGEHIKSISLPVSTVISSVSCRARQTATMAFDGYDTMNRLLVHTGPYNERPVDRTKKLIEFYSGISISTGSNVVISAHNSVIKKSMFQNSDEIDEKLYLEEGGFYVISQDGSALVLEHEFNNFLNFSRVFYSR